MPSGSLQQSGAYSVIPIPAFSGLNLAAGTEDPDLLDSGQAIDLLNVVFTQLGALKQRPGYAKFSATLTNQPDSVHGVYTSGGVKRLLVGNGNRIDALNTSGTSVANVAPTANPQYFARFGTPTAEEVYIANGTDTVRKYVPSTDTFSTPTYTGTTPTGNFLAVTHDFRLACAKTATNPSRVLFSDPGTPTTFGTANYVDLDPGDGEAIMGMAAWRENLFVFKETKFYVFFSTSTDASGAPIFDYRPIRARCGLVASRAVTAARDGIYFLDRKGVYKTTGADATQVSPTLDPFFIGNPSIYFKSSPANLGQIQKAAMAFHNERVYLALPTGSSATNDRVLVHDPRYGWWSLFDIPMAAMTTFRPSNADELLFAYPAGTKNVGRYFDNSGYLADNLNTDGTGGTAIPARWRSGWFTYFFRYRGRWWPETTVITLRQLKAWGEGSLTLATAKDYRDSFSAPQSMTLGPSPELWGDGTDPLNVWAGGGNPADLWGPAGTTHVRLIRGLAQRGTKFSVLISNSGLNTTFTLHELEAHLKGSRMASILETAE